MDWADYEDVDTLDDDDVEEESHPCPECGCEMGSDTGIATAGLCDVCYENLKSSQEDD